MDRRPMLGVIGGSGVYDLEGLGTVERRTMTTPFGAPSSPILIGDLGGKTVAFLARHGIGHTIAPAEVNYRANIYALKALGIERVISVSACGSLREDYAPGDVVIPDQLFDRTAGRDNTFFGDGVVVHVSVAEPFCHDLSAVLEGSLECGEGVCRAGQFVWRPAGSRHEAWAGPDGGVMIAMFQIPNRFYEQDGREIDFLGNDWKQAWGEAYERLEQSSV